MDSVKKVDNVGLFYRLLGLFRMNYIALDKLLHLHDGYRQVFQIQNHKILLIQEHGRRYAIQADCPHSDWPLQNSIVSSGEIICSQHGWSFNLSTGSASNERSISGGCRLKCYKLAFEGSTVGILL
jgi:nitrite reductase/ring-hydroxylating ferredoxin subunit